MKPMGMPRAAPITMPTKIQLTSSAKPFAKLIMQLPILNASLFAYDFEVVEPYNTFVVVGANF